uniref:serine carboxypeptidase-like 31 n=1 Tax=Fragaria vesca subsp. vesca TaxID=101020 RepID=UPI0005CA8B5E|nr:PREDICTED: serine carboxypeptidase-like 31 [Fragaria vesca subsp. vesca]
MEFVVRMIALFFILATVVEPLPVLGSRRTLQKYSSLETGISTNSDEDLVTNLPSQPAVDFKHYAGYVTVSETNGRALFYWFFEAATTPDQKPLVLWLNGGPGCSSVGYGATQEIGPFLLDIESQGFIFNNYSWNKEANVLFVESPIGVGFSYTNTTSDFHNLGDNFTAQDSYTFLHKWFLKFPSFRNRTLYIAGESYAGKYIPELAEVIFDRNSDPSLHIDLKGILMGNPETYDAEDWRGLVDYAWSHAVVSDETHKLINDNCDFHSNDTWSNKNCTQGVDEVFKQYKEIDLYSLYTPTCTTNDTASSYTAVSKMHLMTMKRTSTMIPRIMGGYDPCLDGYSKKFFNKADVQKALHVSDGLQLKNWSICNDQIFSNWSDSRPSLLPTYKTLIAAGLRIWVYSGDTDGRVPVLSTRYSLSALGLPITKTWRPWYHQKQVSGWYQEYEGLTYATFRGAGHDVPSFKPAESLVLFTSFLLGESPPSTR